MTSKYHEHLDDKLALSNVLPYPLEAVVLSLTLVVTRETYFGIGTNLCNDYDHFLRASIYSIILPLCRSISKRGLGQLVSVQARDLLQL
jgi:hypothetical protein